jgi:hypothetical protein
MLVDYERAWLELKAATLGKQGIGVGTLHSLMAELEISNRVEEGLPERALRLYGVLLGQDLTIGGHSPAPTEALAQSLDGNEATPSDSAESGSKENHNAGEQEAVRV